jgi:hypothetical protein
MQQLDIFADSRDRVLLNRMADALQAGVAAEAAAALQAWRAEFPDDRHLAAAELLLEALQAESQSRDLAFADAAAAAAARDGLRQRLAPAADCVLGSAGARAWLAGRWQALAQRAQRLPFAPGTADTHAAALWLQAGDWQAAAAAVETIESWRRKPAALAWMALARRHLQGMDAAWPLLAELAWLAPARLPVLLPALADRGCTALSRRFEADFDTGIGEALPDAAWAWWPAWLLTEQALLASALDGAESGTDGDPERAFRLIRSLLHLERQGRHAERVEQRRRLQALSPALFAAYMATR